MEHVVDAVFFGILVIGPYCVPPIMVWGWYRWWKGRTARTAGEWVALTGFLFASASALLAVGLYMRLTYVDFSDQAVELIRFFGMRTAIASIPFTVIGTGWPGPLRWPALACSLLLPFFWMAVGWDR